MLLKALFFAILIYFVLKTAARLISAMKSENGPSHLNREHTARWEGGTQPRPYKEEDVEDAKFVDVG